jgi:hypothetical protein
VVLADACIVALLTSRLTLWKERMLVDVFVSYIVFFACTVAIVRNTNTKETYNVEQWCTQLDCYVLSVYGQWMLKDRSNWSLDSRVSSHKHQHRVIYSTCDMVCDQCVTEDRLPCSSIVKRARAVQNYTINCLCPTYTWNAKKISTVDGLSKALGRTRW